MRATRVDIDHSALRHNLECARRAVPGSRIMAAIKADGYGHGLLRVAKGLAGADSFGVACIDEALELRNAGVTASITLLEGFFHATELAAIEEHDLDVVVHHPHQLRALAERNPRRPLRVWLKVDSGMHRLGFLPEDAVQVWQRLGSIAGIERLGFLTHLANADDLANPAPTRKQLETFAAVVAGQSGMLSIANSAGLLGWTATRGDWARPGIMLYGVSPFIGEVGSARGLRPVMTLRSELIAVNHLRAGDAVGYGGTWHCPEPMPVGVVAAGYGDGYPRHAASGTPVLVNGVEVPLIGRVSMDMLTVDLRRLPGARVGDPVVLWGAGLPVERVAECAGTIAYELLCQITARVPRHDVG